MGSHKVIAWLSSSSKTMEIDPDSEWIVVPSLTSEPDVKYVDTGKRVRLCCGEARLFDVEGGTAWEKE
jgi:hypothetical protein